MLKTVFCSFSSTASENSFEGIAPLSGTILPEFVFSHNHFSSVSQGLLKFHNDFLKQVNSDHNRLQIESISTSQTCDCTPIANILLGIKTRLTDLVNSIYNIKEFFIFCVVEPSLDLEQLWCEANRLLWNTLPLGPYCLTVRFQGLKLGHNRVLIHLGPFDADNGMPSWTGSPPLHCISSDIDKKSCLGQTKLTQYSPLLWTRTCQAKWDVYHNFYVKMGNIGWQD